MLITNKHYYKFLSFFFFFYISISCTQNKEDTVEPPAELAGAQQNELAETLQDELQEDLEFLLSDVGEFDLSVIDLKIESLSNLRINDIIENIESYESDDGKKLKILTFTPTYESGLTQPDYLKICVKKENSTTCIYEDDKLIDDFFETVDLEKGAYSIDFTPCVDKEKAPEDGNCGTTFTHQTTFDGQDEGSDTSEYSNYLKAKKVEEILLVKLFTSTENIISQLEENDSLEINPLTINTMKNSIVLGESEFIRTGLEESFSDFLINGFSAEEILSDEEPADEKDDPTGDQTGFQLTTGGTIDINYESDNEEASDFTENCFADVKGEKTDKMKSSRGWTYPKNFWTDSMNYVKDNVESAVNACKKQYGLDSKGRTKADQAGNILMLTGATIAAGGVISFMLDNGYSGFKSFFEKNRSASIQYDVQETLNPLSNSAEAEGKLDGTQRAVSDGQPDWARAEAEGKLDGTQRAVSDYQPEWSKEAPEIKIGDSDVKLVDSKQTVKGFYAMAAGVTIGAVLFGGGIASTAFGLTSDSNDDVQDYIFYYLLLGDLRTDNKNFLEKFNDTYSLISP